MLVLPFLLRAIEALPLKQECPYTLPNNGVTDIIIREVKIGQLNFLHTTDTHGWMGSHLNQPDYDANWGDYASFIERFQQNRIGDSDLLIVDTGDKRNGNGLSDAYKPLGLYTSKVFNEVDFDLLTLGNHELYDESVTLMEYYETALNIKFLEKYVSSNVEFLKEDGSLVPFGKKYRYFETPNQKLRILAFSFMFKFQKANRRAKVTPIMDEVVKPWFTDVLQKYPQETVDVIVVFGHIPVSGPESLELQDLHTYLREVYPDTVIQYLGGHTHIRDFVVLDNKATGLQSGRFAETVGFISIDNVTAETPTFSRRYIDFNIKSFLHHANLDNRVEFGTNKGLVLSKTIDKIRDILNLTEVYGRVPETYYMDAVPFTSSNNIYNFLSQKVLPTLEKKDPSITRMILINSGAIRYDLYSGNFTSEIEYVVSPFENTWLYTEVPLALAEAARDIMNQGTNNIAIRSSLVAERERKTCPFVENDTLTLGYTTADDLGCDGDDTPHSSYGSYPVPNIIDSVQWNADSKDKNQTIHLVFYSFLRNSVLSAMNTANQRLNITSQKYGDNNIKTYGGLSTKQLLRTYIGSITPKYT
ncbi:HGL336Cp [Eremothecium sinecaudum]|uniref:HGL336Cp n=1 Tax=Eremothecium sinecaudum TaxID=45286 RepID=A0A0X8HUZ2_9SACH|nr:HGL336Cp [Eremothecium sinecaudum]AMD22004.1 HGL336Cp [Eremothecium sinecaudum]